MIPMIGEFKCWPAMLPKKRASPKVNTPPSEATIQ
jgi:hypothetical protein